MGVGEPLAVLPPSLMGEASINPPTACAQHALIPALPSPILCFSSEVYPRIFSPPPPSTTMKLLIVTVFCLAVSMTSAWVSPAPNSSNQGRIAKATDLKMSEEPIGKPTTFREAEVVGLRLMQEGQFADALKTFKDGMKLPGSRPDVIRTKLLAGPSPVGGAFGGLESAKVLTLDEFELQAAHYNMACAHSQLGEVAASVSNLELCFENGFNNFNTCRGDPDLKALQGSPEFDVLMEQYDSKKGFNPFGLFNK